MIYLFFAVVINVVAVFATEHVLCELLYVDDLVLMSEIIEGLRIRSINWKEALESKGLKVSLGKTKGMVSGGIIKYGMSKNKFDPCGVCSLRERLIELCVCNVVNWSTVDVLV